MTSFGWKRKIGEKVSRAASSAFQLNANERDDNSVVDDDVDWLTLAPKRSLLLEDAAIKSSRLKEEGTTLCEAERYWEAIKKWDEAIQLTPCDAVLHDLKAQVLLILLEVFPAVQFAEKATRLQPNWWSAFQTLGRALLGLGEVHLAVRAFSKAVHLNPIVPELWENDLKWASTLLKQKQHITTELDKKIRHGSSITEIDSDDGEDRESHPFKPRPIENCQNLKVSATDSQQSSMNTPTNTTVPSHNSAANKTVTALPSDYVMMR